MPNIKKICLVDDHKLVRDAVKLFLMGEDDLKVVAEFATGSELMADLKNVKADLFIVDLILPDIHGLNLIIPIKEMHPMSAIIVLTSELDEDLVCQAVKRGARGFLHKDITSEEIVEAIKNVLSGEPWFGQKLSGLIYKSYCKKVKETVDPIIVSDREAEVIKLIGDGLSVKEIANELNLSPRTIESHKTNLLSKLELDNTVSLIKYGIRQKIIEI